MVAGRGPAGDRRAEREVEADLAASGLSPGELLALIETEQVRASAALAPDARLIYGVWGVAWLVGFGLLHLADTAGATAELRVPASFARVSFSLLLLGAAGVTGLHLARRFAGVRGVSSRVGAMYGWAWLVGFGAGAAITAGAARGGAGEPLLRLLSCALSGLVVGLLYLTGGAVWQDRVQYGLGLWILLVTAAGALVGAGGIYLVMSLAGGGGFLLAAAWFAVRTGGTPRSQEADIASPS